MAGVDIGSLPPATVMPDGTTRGAGNRVGWYIRPDGQAARLSIEPVEKDYYERHGFTYQREWGEYRQTVDRRGDVDVWPETKYEQLARLAGVFPEARRLLATMYSKKREAVRVYTARDGELFETEFALRAYEMGLDDAAPVVAHPCPTCGAGHANAGVLALHIKRSHP